MAISHQGIPEKTFWLNYFEISGPHGANSPNKNVYVRIIPYIRPGPYIRYNLLKVRPISIFKPIQQHLGENYF